MSKKDKWTRRLDDILDCIADIEEYMAGKKRSDLEANKALSLALERSFSIIGEAANHIPKEIKQEFSSIAWSDIYAMRNILVHAYDRVSADILWLTIQDDLSPIKSIILKIKEKYDV